VFKEFFQFLKEYNIVTLALAFVMGTAATALVNSLVNDIVMPFFSPFLSSESWKTATLDLGLIHIAYGSFLAQLINFTILGFVVFFVAKKILKEEKVSKK